MIFIKSTLLNSFSHVCKNIELILSIILPEVCYIVIYTISFFTCCLDSSACFVFVFFSFYLRNQKKITTLFTIDDIYVANMT